MLNQQTGPFQKVGKIKEAHGLKGDVYVLVFSGDVSWSFQIRYAQVHVSDSDIRTLEIEKSKPHKDGLIVKFKELSNRDQSEEIEGAGFFIPAEALISKKGETIYLQEVLGFEVFLKDRVVGNVKEFSSNGPQDLLVIQGHQGAFEVPFVAPFIVKIDFDAQKLIMDFPEDLLNLQKID